MLRTEQPLGQQNKEAREKAPLCLGLNARPAREEGFPRARDEAGQTCLLCAEDQVGLSTQTLPTLQLCSTYWGSLTSNTHHRQRLTLKWIPFQRSPGKKVTRPLTGSQPTYYPRKHLVSSSLNNKVPGNSQTTTSHPLSPDIHSHRHKHMSTLLFPTLQPHRRVVPN